MSARRLQRTRQRGYRMPEGAVYVGRPTKWGNPFPLTGSWTMWTAVALGYRADTAGRRAAVVALHRAWLLGEPIPLGPHSKPAGGVIEFDDGSQVSMSDHCRGIAALGASFSTPPTIVERPTDFAEIAGRDLVCWCPLDQPCHADALLEVANRERVLA